MDNYNQNRLNMLLAVQRLLDQHTVTWSRIPILTNYKNQLDQLITNIEVLEEEGNASSKATTRDKNQLKDFIAEKTAILCGAMYAYAINAGNSALEDKANLSPSDITRLRDAEVPGFVTPIIQTLKDELANLADYGITEAQITELETSVDDYRPLVGQGRLIQSASAVANRQVKDLVGDGVELLNETLDKLMLQFKLSDPAFYQKYERARVIVDN